MSFANSAFLLGLGALAVPLILHLMSREKPRRVVFPTIRYIKKGQRVQHGRRGIKDFWVMLARMLILAAIVLLLADPFIPRPVAVISKDADQVVVMVDLSASMRAANFDEFVANARKQIEAAHPNAEVGAIGSADGVIYALPVTTPNLDVWATILADKPRSTVGNHSDAISRIGSLMTTEEGPGRHVYVLSDLQAVDWQPERLGALDVAASVRIIAPPHSNSRNVAILGVDAESVERDGTRNLRLTIRLRNFWLEPVDTSLIVRVGSVNLLRPVVLQAGDTATVTLTLPDVDGSKGTVELASMDEYVDDDVFHFWAGPQPPLHVAVVANSATDRSKQSEVFFLSNALSISLPGTPMMAVTSRGPDIMWDTDIASFQSVFLLDAIADFSEAEAGLLHEYCSNGGTLVLFAGNRTADCLNRLADAGFNRINFRGFYGGVGRFRSSMVDSADTAHPLIAPFAEDAADLTLFPIYKAARLDPGKKHEILLAAGELPLLIREQVGRGELYVIGTSLSASWSELPTAICFLPLVRRMVELSTAADDRRVLNRILGKPLGIELPDETVAPTSPDVLRVGDQPVQVNYTREESDFTAVSDAAVRAHLTTQDVLLMADEREVPENERDSLQAHVAWALIAGLFIELLLANFRRKEA